MIYAIIVTYNGSRWVDKCFGSLVSSSIPLKILAIDNCSKDGTPALIRARFPQVEVIETGQNLGFGKANNIGLKRVLDEKADYAFLLNQDAWVEEDTIEKLITAHKANSLLGIISPVHLNGAGDGIDYNFSNYLGPRITPRFYSDMYLGCMKNIYESEYANAAAWLLPLATVTKLGGFDPQFSHYGEDDDYIVRTKLAGFKIAIVSGVHIYHDRPQGVQSAVQKNNSTTIIATLRYKSLERNPIKLHYLIRKIITSYFTLWFGHIGKNETVRQDIKVDKLLLKWIILRKPYNGGFVEP